MTLVSHTQNALCPPTALPHASSTQTTCPPSAGKAVDSSAVMSELGSAKTTGVSSVMPSTHGGDAAGERGTADGWLVDRGGERFHQPASPAG